LIRPAGRGYGAWCDEDPHHHLEKVIDLIRPAGRGYGCGVMKIRTTIQRKGYWFDPPCRARLRYACMSL
jgi:hypothetical protein